MALRNRHKPQTNKGDLKMATKITAEVVTIMEELAPLDFHKATRIGDAFDIKPKAIVASATRRGIEYIRKPRVSKSGEAVVTKEDLVKSIASSLGFELGEIDGLLKATKVDLIKVEDRVKGVVIG
jgi:hypothetical protein